ncbi:MAG TPA: hypothetical protein VN836_12055 [Verrucomicrobiae bacterium]|nr:hypothetical protein [Verrucomicrobiae bacterium]
MKQRKPHNQKCTPAYRAMLRCLMPQVETHSKRQKRLFDFLLDSYSDDQQKASGVLDELKNRDSFTTAHCSLIAGPFSDWWKYRLAARRKDIGKTGGRPRKKAKSLDTKKRRSKRT